MTRSARIPAPERTLENQTFTTRDHVGDPWEYWSAITHTAFAAMQATATGDRTMRNGFDASAVALRTGPLALSTMSASPHEASRTPTLIRQAPAQDFFLTLLTEGSGTVQQGERTSRLEPGCVVLVDSARPYAFRFHDRFRSVILQIPRGMLTSRSRAAEQATAVAFTATDGLGAFLTPVLRALVTEGYHLDEATTLSFMGNLVDLLGTACDAHGGRTPDQPRPAHRRDLARAQAYLDARLPDTDLTLLAASHDLGFSIRYLHQLFHEANSTPRRWLYDQRLDRARTMLSTADPRAPIVTEIASRVGFKDPSHFSRAFKARYGVTPADFRRTTMATRG